MQGFVGRDADIEALRAEYERVQASGQGSLVLLKGRRRIGKSWLVEEFTERVGASSLFFLADRLRPALQLNRFAEKLSQSNLPSAGAATGVRYETWEAALVAASAGAARDQPSVIVLDEFPYLIEGERDRVVEASVNAAWERVISRSPVMVVLIGSDFSVMGMLSEHHRPLFDRPTLVRTIRPLDVAEFADISGFEGTAAIDAYHVVGGFPRLARLWRPAWTLRRFLTEQLSDQDSPLVATGRRILDAEFPGLVQAKTVLTVVGAGERTYSNIANASGVGSSNLRRSLEQLEREKHVVTSDVPLSAARSEETRYHITDPYLRFYVRFIDPGLSDVIRGRGASVASRIVRDWQTYLGRAIEPFVRQSVERMDAGELLGATRVGGFWTRNNIPEIDLVGVDDGGPPRVRFIGSIKWRDNSQFVATDTRALIAAAVPATGEGRVPGVDATTPLVGVSRAGFAANHGLVRAFGPEELLAAWRPAGGR